MGDICRFYGQWAKLVLGRTPGLADLYAGVVGTVAGAAAHYRPEMSNLMSELGHRAFNQTHNLRR